MPQYRVKVRSFINNTIVEEGQIVEYEGKPGSNLVLIDKPKAQAGRYQKAQSKVVMPEPEENEDGVEDSSKFVSEDEV